MWEVGRNYRGFAGVVMVIAVLGLVFGMGMANAEDEHWETVENADEAFKVGYFQVTGMSKSGQHRYAAIRAATVVAQRDLLERLKGVRVHGDTTIEDGILQSDTVKTNVEGFLQGARPCGQKYNSIERYAEVCLRLYFNGKGGIYDSVYPAFREGKVLSLLESTAPTKPTTTPPPETAPIEKMVEAANDGVIIEMAGLLFKPAIVNRILNNKGDIIFGPSKVINSILVERGTGGFTNQLDKAKGLLASWGSLNPMLLKAVETRKGTDVVISDAGAAQMFAADQKNSFLSQAKVVFVVN